jgi:hypothetical protein
MDKATVDALMQYYLTLTQLAGLVDFHVKATAADEKFLKDHNDKAPGKFAAFFRKPAAGGPPFPLLEVVELGKPDCTDAEMQGGTCLTKDGLEWEYRFDAGKTTGKMKFLNKQGDSAPAEVLLAVSDNRLFSELKVGTVPQIASEQFQRRIHDIDGLYGALKTVRDRIDEVFHKVELQKKTRFAF